MCEYCDDEWAYEVAYNEGYEDGLLDGKVAGHNLLRDEIVPQIEAAKNCDTWLGTLEVLDELLDKIAQA